MVQEQDLLESRLDEMEEHKYKCHVLILMEYAMYIEITNGEA